MSARVQPAQSSGSHALQTSLFLKACRGEPTPVTPVWLMRQAGRYQESYRRLRQQHSFLDMCKTPELAARVTLDAVEQTGVDAAILFADLLPILEPLGFQLTYTAGEGPVIHNPVTAADDIDRLRPEGVGEAMHFVYDAVRLARDGLPTGVPLIGFAGAPFTLAAYAIEGRGSKNFDRAKAFLYRDPGAWHALLERLSHAVADYLIGQVDAGVQALQLFDSWVGCLSPADYREYVLPHTRRVIDAVKGKVPLIHFGVGTATLLPLMAQTECDVLGFDWRVPLAETWDRLGSRSVQGNLDPCILLTDPARIETAVRALLDSVGGRPGHIFNLGHGILPTTPFDNVKALVDIVHDISSR